MNLKSLLNIIFIVSGIITLQAQEIKVNAKIDSIAIETGDQTWLNLSVEHGKDVVISFPEIKDTIVKGIDVLRAGSIDTQISNDKIIATQKLLITAFDDSIFRIPPFIFKYGNDSLYTESLLLSVASIQLDSVEIAKIDTTQMLQVFDIKEPIDTPWTFSEFIERFYVHLLIILGVAIVIALVVIFIVRRKKNKPFIKLPEKPKEPAHIIAFRELDELKAKKLWQEGKEKAYYSQLTEIIREYLENRFHIATFELTSHELLDSVKSKNLLANELFETLSQTLSIADLAKFAKFKPLPSENDLCLKNAYQLVELTKLVQTTQTNPGQITNNQINTKTLIEEKNSD